MELDVTPSVRGFREMVISSWPVVMDLCHKDKTLSFVDDWLQSTWERIVEASVHPSLQVVLEPYGNGADCSFGSSRVWRPELLPTTPVFVRYVGNEPLLNAVDQRPVVGELRFSHFCTLRDGWPADDIPFDYVALEDDDVVILHHENLRFFVEAAA